MNLAWMGAAATGIAAFWTSIRAWLDTLLSVVWVTTRVEYPAAPILLRYLDEHYHRASLGTPVINAMREYVRPRNRVEIITVLKPGLREFFRNGLAFLVVSAFREQSTGHHTQAIDVSHFRWTFDVAELCESAVQSFNGVHANGVARGRYRVTTHFGMGSARGYGGDQATVGRGINAPQPLNEDLTFDRLRPLRWKPEDLGAPTSDQPFRGLVYPPEIQAVAERIRKWRANEVFFRERRIPWRMGVLAYGPPGTGKTSFARAIAQELDLPVHTFDLRSMENRELRYAWREAAAEAPAVALIEDIDGVFRGKDNVLQDSSLTISALLNCISGVEPSEGLLTILTCNDRTALDAALLRPGRMDLAVEFGPMSVEGKGRLIEALLFPTQKEGMAMLNADLSPTAWYKATASAILDDESLVTPAQVQARCAEIALARLYEEDAA